MQLSPIKKKAAFRIAAATLSVFITLLLLETLSHIYIYFFLPPRTHHDYRKQRPAPYADASYFSDEFIAESFEQPGGWQYPENTRLIIPNDYSGVHFNTKNGLRVTANQPTSYQNTIFLFGGSTIYNSEVPDHHTVASYLQALFSLHYGDNYAVDNYGTTTVTIAQQLERLRTCSPHSGDIVVFYDGVNDIYQSVFYANPEETMIQRNRRTVQGMPLPQRFLLRLSEKSAFAGLFLEPINRSMPPHLVDEPYLDELLASLRSRFMDSVYNANAFSTSHGAVFFHFLQPHLFSDDKYSDYENQLIQNSFIVPAGVKEAFQIGYPELKTATAELSETIYSYDLSDVLNERPEGVEFYLDSCHVTHRANQIVAEKIFDRIKQVIARNKSNSSTSTSNGE